MNLPGSLRVAARLGGGAIGQMRDEKRDLNRDRLYAVDRDDDAVVSGKKDECNISSTTTAANGKIMTDTNTDTDTQRDNATDAIDDEGDDIVDCGGENQTK